VGRQHRHRPIAGQATAADRRLVEGAADRLTGARVGLARAPRTGAVAQPVDPLGLAAAQPGPHRRLVALEDGGDLRHRIAAAGEQDHAHPLADPADLGLGQALQDAPFVVGQRADEDHRAGSWHGSGRRAVAPKSTKQFWQRT
jgi:hypothetical protein